MRNGIGLILLAVVAIGVAGYYGYTQRTTVKMCEVPAFKVTKAEGAKVIQNENATEPKAVMVPCDELEAATDASGS